MTLRVALVGGPMYDHLYDALDTGAMEVVVHADHPTLNRRVAELLAAGERLDLISTHAKYAPSQAQWLRPLDDLLDQATVGVLAPLAVGLCRVEGALMCLPRLIDVRVLWARIDRIDVVPESWDELVDSRVVFGFPGRESGLFGTFFELVVGMGSRLFDDAMVPSMATAEAIEAIATLCRLAARAPAELTDWHYDETDSALLDGRVDAAAAWPGAWGSIASSAVAEHLWPFPYLAGSTRRVSYSGCHAWAIPRTCGDLDGAVALLGLLAGYELQATDATAGNVCAHTRAFDSVRPESDLDRRRLEVTRQMVDTAMITYPPLERFPEIEDAGWSAIRDAVLSRLSPTQAAQSIQDAAIAVLAGSPIERQPLGR